MFTSSSIETILIIINFNVNFTMVAPGAMAAEQRSPAAGADQSQRRRGHGGEHGGAPKHPKRWSLGLGCLGWKKHGFLHDFLMIFSWFFDDFFMILWWFLIAHVLKMSTVWVGWSTVCWCLTCSSGDLVCRTAVNLFFVAKAVFCW